MADTNPPSQLVHRPRRLRLDPLLRNGLQRVRPRRSDLIALLFVCEGKNITRPIASMPGINQMSVDVALDWLKARAQAGICAFLVFGVIDRSTKDDIGSPALDENNVVCQLLRAAQDAKLPMTPITDLCLCEYTSHGHCGPITGNTVDNDRTLPLLVQQAINHANSGARIIAPSGMMDGTVAAIRSGLDAAGHVDVAIMSYSIKYASAFYGPFRDAADSAPAFGDRKSYQMDPSRGTAEALHELKLDIAQGADLVMVKPAGAYLDILSEAVKISDVPIAAYQVSGEYAMLEAAARNGWLDRDRAVLESITAIKRAGADLIITYYTELLEKLLPA